MITHCQYCGGELPPPVDHIVTIRGVDVVHDSQVCVACPEIGEKGPDVQYVTQRPPPPE